MIRHPRRARPDSQSTLKRGPVLHQQAHLLRIERNETQTLGAELVRTRERGFSVCRGEFEESAWGVSAPVLDVAGRPVAVLSIWGPPERITAKRFDSLGDLAVAGAEEIAGRRNSASA